MKIVKYESELLPAYLVFPFLEPDAPETQTIMAAHFSVVAKGGFPEFVGKIQINVGRLSEQYLTRGQIEPLFEQYIEGMKKAFEISELVIASNEGRLHELLDL